MRRGVIPPILANVAMNVDGAYPAQRVCKFLKKLVRHPMMTGITALLLLGLTACSGKIDYEHGASMTGGDPAAGKDKIILHDCHSCHDIPGIPVNRDTRGPSLKHWSRRSTIAKRWPNTPEDLQDFLQHPERMLHGTNMKNEMTMSSVKAGDAKDIAAYLFSLE